MAHSAGAVEYTDCISADSANECSVYDAKQSDGEAPVTLELWGMKSTPSFPSLPGPLWPGMVAPDRVLSEGQLELNSVLMLNWIVCYRTVLHVTVSKQKTMHLLNWIVWNRTVFDN